MGLRVADLFKPIKNGFSALFAVDAQDRKKLLYLTLTFFFVIFAYTIIKELKDSVFVAIVGKTYIPQAKIIAMLALIPAILFYSFLVDRLRRYQLLYFYSFIYGFFGLICAFFLAHPTIGLANTQTSPFRIFGWIFYFFIEGYSPFVVSLFWAFANSVTSPREAKNYYGLMVSGSKLGGISSSLLSWAVLTYANPLGGWVTTDIGKHQFLMGLASVMVLLVPVVIMLLMHTVSGKNLHGYEAAYKVEKERAKTGKSHTGVFSGLLMFFRYPYLMGIFCMVFFYEVINTVLSYERITVAQANGGSMAQVSGFLYQIIFWTHLVGFTISLIGTKTLLRKLGEKRCLLLVPVTTGLMLFYYLMYPSHWSMLFVFVVIRAINYGFSYPVRESLYIPTVKDIKFKSKSWIDSFGTKFAKSSGSTFNIIVDFLGNGFIIPAYSGFFGVIIGVWIFAALLLGRRFEWAVAHDEVIGADS